MCGGDRVLSTAEWVRSVGALSLLLVTRDQAAVKSGGRRHIQKLIISHPLFHPELEVMIATCCERAKLALDDAFFVSLFFSLSVFPGNSGCLTWV